MMSHAISQPPQPSTRKLQIDGTATSFFEWASKASTTIRIHSAHGFNKLTRKEQDDAVTEYNEASYGSLDSVTASRYFEHRNIFFNCIDAAIEAAAAADAAELNAALKPKPPTLLKRLTNAAKKAAGF